MSPVNFTWRRDGSTLPICGPLPQRKPQRCLTLPHYVACQIKEPMCQTQALGTTMAQHFHLSLPKIIPRHHLKTSTGLNQPSLVLRGFVHCRRLILQLLIHSSDLHAEGARGSAFRSQRVDPGLNIGTF